MDGIIEAIKGKSNELDLYVGLVINAIEAKQSPTFGNRTHHEQSVQGILTQIRTIIDSNQERIETSETIKPTLRRIKEGLTYKKHILEQEIRLYDTIIHEAQGRAQDGDDEPRQMNRVQNRDDRMHALIQTTDKIIAFLQNNPR